MAEPVQVVVDSASLQNAYYVIGIMGVILTLIGGACGGAFAYARSLHTKIDKDRDALAEFKTHVAGNYVSVNHLDQVMRTILESIKEAKIDLGNRIALIRG